MNGRDINDVGQVVGWLYPIGANWYPFLTGPNGVGITKLEPLGGDWIPSGLNDAGQVVGTFNTTPNNGFNYHAFITGPNGVGTTDLGTLGVAVSPMSSTMPDRWQERSPRLPVISMLSLPVPMVWA